MGGEIEHKYGEQVHILDDAFMLTALARLSSPESNRQEVLSLLRSVNQTLITTAVGRELRTVGAEIPTRMNEIHAGHGVYRGKVFDLEQKIVVVDVVRGGILPSQLCFELLTSVLPDANVRLDHLTMSRTTDSSGQVTGVDLSGSKIGGSVDGSIMIIPDPMGASGGTALRALAFYEERFGTPEKILCLPTICTPEFLKAVSNLHPNVSVYTARLDRGLSSPEVLATTPGERWDEERGLDEHSYIVPGAGGMGEILNNSWC